MWRSSGLNVGFGGKINRIVHSEKNLFPGLLSHKRSVLLNYHVSN